jgi:hypothetical protein
VEQQQQQQQQQHIHQVGAQVDTKSLNSTSGGSAMNASPAKVRPNDVCVQRRQSSSSSSKGHTCQFETCNQDCSEDLASKVAIRGLCMQHRRCWQQKQEVTYNMRQDTNIDCAAAATD